MSRRDLLNLLDSQGVKDIQPGYNYVVYSLHMPAEQVDAVIDLLRKRRRTIERQYGKMTKQRLVLLPFVCLPRKRSVLVPVPFNTSLNMMTEAILTLDLPRGVSVPNWD